MLHARWVVIALSVAASVRYLHWRATETLNFQSAAHSAISILLLLAEFYGFISLFLFFVQSLRPVQYRSVPMEDADLPTVDILVTIFDEPASILYKTLVCCQALDYPREKFTVYVLDDGARPSIKAMAEKLGCAYIARHDRRHAKAGNINHALPLTDGELVVTLDTDHIPVRSFLRETAGFFQDPKVAFVQLPHHFYNPDIFQENLLLEGELVHEQDLFFQVILPGRQFGNSVVYAGSSAILRRSAIESIGGIQTACAIEDTHTGMRLQAKGYRGVFYNKILSCALSPESLKGYLVQRARWCRGGVQLAVLDNPLLRPGLSLLQRLHYCGSLLYFFHGWARLIYLLSPLAFLLWRFDPIVTGTGALIGMFLPHYILSHLAFLLVSRQYRNPFWSDVYETASVFHLSWTAFATLLQPERLIFNVTPKAEGGRKPGEVHWSFVLPHGVMLVLLLAGIIVASHRMSSERLRLDAYTLSCAWAFFNVVLLGCVIEGARERHQARAERRLKRRIPCELSYHGKSFAGHIENASTTGILVVLDHDDHMPPIVHLSLRTEDGESLELDGEVVHQNMPLRGGTRVGIRLTDVTEEIRRSMILRIFSAPDSWEEVKRPFSNSWSALFHIVTSVLRPRLRKPRHHKRKRARIRISVPVEFSAGAERASAMLKDISVCGAGILVDGAQPVPGEVTLHVPVGDREVEVRAEVVRRILHENAPVLYGMRFISPAHLDIHDLEALEDVTSG